jgi:gamma-glutamyl hydrolase
MASPNHSILFITFSLILIIQFVLGSDLPRYNFDILTDRPVIGILAQPISDIEKTYTPNRQYIAASYIKYIESAGGRVVPINWYSTREEIFDLLPNLNGLLLTGGGSPYHDVIDYLYDAAVEMNKKGIFFPVWSTCQGFQFTGIYFSKKRDLLQSVIVDDLATPLHFEPEAQNSDWFNDMPTQFRELLSDTNATMNFHHWGITLADYGKYLSTQFDLISTNISTNNIEHVSTMSHKTYPFTAVQWHPEKMNFEFQVDSGSGSPMFSIPHTYDNIRITQYCSNWFVHQCRRNDNRFSDWKDLQANLIYNWSPIRSSPIGFVENYVFDHWPIVLK